SIAHDAVLARRARKHREKFRISQSASERKQSSYQPHRERDSGSAHIARHHTRFQKHAGADNVRDVNCNRGGETKAADQLTVRNFGVLSLEVRVHFRLFKPSGFLRGRTLFSDFGEFLKKLLALSSGLI